MNHSFVLIIQELSVQQTNQLWSSVQSIAHGALEDFEKIPASKKKSTSTKVSLMIKFQMIITYLFVGKMIIQVCGIATAQ